MATTATDVSGTYRFAGLDPGDYAVEFELPAGRQFTSQNQGDDDAVDSDANPTTGRTEVLTLAAGEEMTADAGMSVSEVTLASVGGSVTNDLNQNGVKDLDEPGISNVRVNLRDPVTNGVIATTTTDSSGAYLFADLVPGDYVLEFESPPGGELTTPSSTTVTLSPGEHETTTGAGISTEKAPRIKAYMTTQDSTGGSVVPGDVLEYTVTLENIGDATGTGIVFDDDPAGHLTLIPGTVETSAGTVITGNDPSDTGVTVEVGDLVPSQRTTITFQARVSEDVPIGGLISNQGRVRMDGYPDEVTDNPSTASPDDATEVVVTDEEPHIYDPPTTYKTVSGDRPVLYWEMVWINDSNVDAIRVHIEDDIPAELTYVEGSLDADYGTSSYDHATHTVIWEGTIAGNGGEVKIWYHTSVPDDVNEVENQACGVWDRNGDGEWTDESAEGVTVCSDDPDSPSSGDATVWQGVPCNLSLGDIVWDDANQDGVCQSGTETGLDGVSINLYRDSDVSGDFTPDTDDLLATVTTSSVEGDAGHYLFANLCEGSYIVQVAPENFDDVLNGYSSSLGTSDPDDDTDNDDNGAAVPGYGVVTTAVTLSAGDESVTDGDADPNTNLTVDFGFQSGEPVCPDCPRLVTLGDRVWNDANNDGIWQPESETGMDGVHINLYRDGDVSGDYTPDVDVLVGVAVTFTLNGEPGHYLFRGLDEGDYILQADPSNFERCGALNGYVSSPGSEDPDDGVNSDDNGEPTDGHGVLTLAVTLTAGDESVDDGDMDPNTNMTVDFGFHQVEIIPNPCDASLLGGVIWDDADQDRIRDPGETGMDDVRVNLYRDSDGSGDFTRGTDEFVTSAVTFAVAGEAGRYTFENLSEGSYIVQVAPQNFEDYDVLDGYAGSTTDIVLGEGATSEAIAVAAGVEVETVGLGFYQDEAPTVRMVGYVWDDANGDGVCQHGTETAFDGVSVRLYRDSDGSGDLTATDEVVRTAVTFTDDGKAGTYIFESLDEGTAYLVQIPPENFDEGGALGGYSATGFTSEHGLVGNVVGGGQMAMALHKTGEDIQEESGSDNCFIGTAAGGEGSLGGAPMLMLMIGVVGILLGSNRRKSGL